MGFGGLGTNSKLQMNVMGVGIEDASFGVEGIGIAEYLEERVEALVWGFGVGVQLLGFRV